MTRAELKADAKLAESEWMADRTNQDMLEAQDFKCAICGIEECLTGNALAVDHCHKTEKVRGLLCQQCNIGLGNFGHNPDTLIEAATYLETDRD